MKRNYKKALEYRDLFKLWYGRYKYFKKREGVAADATKDCKATAEYWKKKMNKYNDTKPDK